MKKMTVTMFFMLIIGLLIGLTLGRLAEYNDGICPDCKVEYETNRYIYEGNEWIRYSCPECNEGGSIQAFLTF